ncbi:hypothetical protein GCM10007937_60860 [Mesorhizobium albiziae]|nr:hypothetical protein GCM10007937_60860 [Mesorhizobium albiziae]
MGVGRFLGLAIAVAASVGKLHQRDLVHKDIKPANILVNVATDEVRLTGFGIASRLARERQSPRPPETIAGTLSHMAPEQTGRMNRSIDSRSDLYALGVTFYQMLTGALPFTAADPMEWVHCHLAKRPVAPADRRREIPGVISSIVMKLLAKRAEDRYQTAAGLEWDLRGCQAVWQAHGRIDEFPLGENDTPDRLVIPEKLYGRRKEVETLLASFNRVASGGPTELVLVSGYSGVGKSSVVNELQPILAPPRGLFASGKFDQYKRDIPYSTLALAFQSLVRPLLGKSDADLAPWRDALQKALGPNAALIIDLVPEVKLIIGEPPPVPELPPQDKQQRFQLVFRQFVGVFARLEHPLALFLDDLQWLDAGTLDILEDLLTRSDLRNLLVIGAYRDNEVTVGHPLMDRLETIRRVGRVNTIRLEPLSIVEVGKLVADSLHCEPDDATALAQVVHAKTDGNPFFVIQFLQVLADEGLLGFDHEHGRWSWDIVGIHAKQQTDNVVELLTPKLKHLPFNTQGALWRLACLGNIADVATLSMVLGKPEEQVHAALWEALRQQMIDRIDGTYKFAHDRVQEAAYALIPEKSRAKTHLSIGRLLTANTPADRRDEAVFNIVNQFDRAAALITEEAEREHVAALNLAAGRRAKAAGASAAALRYLEAGRALIGNDGWARHYRLTFDLELHLAECEYLVGRLPEAEQRLLALSEQAQTPIDTGAVAYLLINLYIILDRSDDAVAVGLSYLRQRQPQWSLHPTADDIRQECSRLWRQIEGASIPALLDLPLMNDPEQQATMNALTALISAAQFTNLNLFHLIIIRMVALSLEHGNTEGSCFGYALLGSVPSLHSDQIHNGFRVGEIALDLVEKHRFDRIRGTVYYLFALFTAHWTQPLATCQGLFRRAFEAARDVGDLKNASFSRVDLVTNLLAAGESLDEVEREASSALTFVQSVKFGLISDVISAQLGLVRALRGQTPKLNSFNDGIFDEKTFEQHLEGDPLLAVAASRYWIRKLQLKVYAGDYDDAVKAALKAEWLLWTLPAQQELPEYHFYAGLAWAGHCDATATAGRDDTLQRLRTHQEKFAYWALSGPENFVHRAALLGAELARLERRESDATRLYEEAIFSAREHRFVQHEGLANELAARSYAGRGFETIANAYLSEARFCYLRWGADGKVRQLEALHPFLHEPESGRAAATTIAVPIEHLDYATVVKVSQAVSGEMELERLIDTLMRLAIEHTGAERGVLLLSRGSELQLDAEAMTSRDGIVVRRSGESADVVPDSLVHYAMRSREVVLLDDASAHHTYSLDAYVRARRARSVLCLPLVNEAKVTGVLYLENNLAPNVFTPDRVTVLKVLASQAAISLENSRLYRDLADREAKIRRLVDANILGICIWDLEGRILSANEAFLRMLQYGREDYASGRLRWTDMTPDELRARDEQAVAELRSTGTFQPFEKEFFRKDGTRIPVLIGGALFEVGGSDGVAFVLDLTERKCAETAVRESEGRFRDYAETASDWFWEIDTDYRFTHLTENAFGSDPAPRIGTVCWDHALDVETEPDKWRLVWAALESRQPFRDFTYCVAGGNGPMYVKASGKPVFDTNGEFRGYRGTGTDVTAIIRAQEALLESERSLRSAIDGIPGLVGVLAPDGDVQAINRQIVEYTGQSLEELKNWGTNGTVHVDDISHVAEVFTRAIASGIPYQIEQRLRRFDGEYRWFDNRGIPIRDDSGRIIRWYVLLTDIEDRTRALARVQQMQSDFAHINRVSTMGVLAASLSHEITQPIASARNNARAALNFLEKQPPDLAEVREALGCIVGDADRAGNIVDRIREHIRKAPPRKSYFDLGAAINEVLVLARSTIMRNGVSVQTRLADGRSRVYGDRVQLQQVMLNLILNAVEAMAASEFGARELSICARQDQEGALVAVGDSGPGIDPEQLESIFEAFYTTKSSGTGMGLLICRSIISAHGGRLWAESNDSRGAVFQFTLPDAHPTQ